ncbi:MAG: AP2 domain-containing protein [Nitrospira sp.]|nr:AP2 domain-containing protein [Nitrospira sp.]
MTRSEYCQIKKKNNKSGISGVTRIDAKETNQGKIRRWQYWLAQWPIGGGKAKQKNFSIKIYGEQGARQRAVHARQAALKRLAKN